jgi:WD40 repeat protein
MKQRVLSFDEGKLQPLSVDSPGPIRWVSWDRKEGSSLLAGDRGALFEYRKDKFSAVPSSTAQNLRCVEYHPDGGFAYACGNQGTIFRVDSSGATPVQGGIQESLRRLGWNAPGNRALFVGNAGAAYLMDRDRNLVKVVGAETHLRSVAWHPKDDVAIVAGNCFRDSIGSLTPSPNLFEMKGSSLEEITDIEGSRADFTAASWRPDGSTCLIAGFDQTWHTSSLVSYSRGMLTDVKWGQENLFPTAISWNPSGSYALIGTSPLAPDEGTASLYRYQDGAVVTKVTDLDGFGVSCIAWKDEGLALIACSRSVRAFSV